ncbi:MAG: hypothetical protein Q7O66_01125 [Dehalococcoidia bacterium]|nr:hypothetical protein [Dehalococcoidia bacterium]
MTEIHEYAYEVRLYETVGPDGRDGWRGEMRDSVDRAVCTAWAPDINLLWAMLREALPDDGEGGE